MSIEAHSFSACLRRPSPRHGRVLSSGRIMVLLVACSILLPTGGVAAQAVTVRDAWVREAATGRAVTAVFMTLVNQTDKSVALVRGSASVGDTLELHEMKREGTMMRMAPVHRMEIPAHGETELRPGGLHLMIFGLKAPLALGDTVRLTLTLDNGTTLKAVAPVRSMQRMSP